MSPPHPILCLKKREHYIHTVLAGEFGVGVGAHAVQLVRHALDVRGRLQIHLLL